MAAPSDPGSLPRFVLLMLLVFGSAYSVLIWKLSMVVGNERYFVIFDDVMISMRYARNLASGYGLVWNPGEAPVEGFTNLLWVLFMSALHLLPIGLSKLPALVCGMSALLMLLTAVVAAKLSRALEPGNLLAPGIAALLCAGYGPLAYWSLVGFETALIALLYVGMAYLVVSQVTATRHVPWAVGVMAALACATRMDCLPTVIMLLLAVGLVQPRQSFFKILGPVVLTLAAMTVFRFFYYGELMPNTYYLKLTGLSLFSRAVFGLKQLITSYQTHQALILFVALVGYASIKHPLRTLLPAMAIGQYAYVVYAGGGTWDWHRFSNRHVSTVMPLLLVLAAHGVSDLSKRFSVRLAVPRTVAAWFLAACVAFVSIYPFHMMGKFEVEESDVAEMLNRALYIRENTPTDTKVAVEWAGVLPYYAERHCIDILGKNDKHVARMSARTFEVGHNKWDFSYSFDELQADIVVTIPGRDDLAVAQEYGFEEGPLGMFYRK